MNICRKYFELCVLSYFFLKKLLHYIQKKVWSSLVTTVRSVVFVGNHRKIVNLFDDTDNLLYDTIWSLKYYFH